MASQSRRYTPEPYRYEIPERSAYAIYTDDDGDIWIRRGDVEDGNAVWMSPEDAELIAQALLSAVESRKRPL